MARTGRAERLVRACRSVIVRPSRPPARRACSFRLSYPGHGDRRPVVPPEAHAVQAGEVDGLHARSPGCSRTTTGRLPAT